MQSSSLLRLVAALWVGVAMLAGCGGGGGSSSRDPLPSLSQDILPTGSRLAVGAASYMPAAPGDQWIYDQLVGGTVIGTVTRSAAFSPAPGEVAITESGPTQPSVTGVYRRTAEGVFLVDPLNDTGLTSLQQALPQLLEYPEPFYATGSTRQVIRQGSLGDLDGDGSAESFRIEYRQTLVGFETVTLGAARIADAAHFRNVLTVTLQPSDRAEDIVTAIFTEDVWLAPGIGAVRANVSAVDGNGNAIIQPYTLQLRGGTVGGEPLLAPALDGVVTKVALTHSALVFDAPRARFLASVPGSVPSFGNSIAIIDATNGSVSYSQPIGSEPGALALAEDGSALYVGLDGSGEVAKLRLPDLAVQWRVQLPSRVFGPTRAESIAVSPLDADVVSVSLYRSSVSPRHDGVALIRAGVVQPRLTQDHTGSNLIVFDADGSQLYGFNTETTEFGLRRIEVLADGLSEAAVVRDALPDGFSVRTMDRTSGSGPRVLLGRSLFTTPALALAGQAGADASACRWHTAAARIVCLGTSGSGDRSVLVVDPASLVTTAAPVFSRAGGTGTEVGQIVPGGRGVVALRLGPINLFQPASGLWLFTSPQLP